MQPLFDSLSFLSQHYARAVHWRKGKDGPRCIKEPLKRKHLVEHLTPNAPPVGLAFVAPGETVVRAALFDLDDHRGAGWDKVVVHAKKIISELKKADYHPHVFRSSGGKGIHIITLWAEPQDAYSVRAAMADIAAKCKLKVGTKGLANKEVEVFPKQDSVPDGGYGSMAILPLAQESLPLDDKFNLCEPDILESVAYWQYSPSVEPRARPLPSRPAVTVDPPMASAEYGRLTAALSNISADCGYDEWLQVLAALHHESDGSIEGYDIACQWSATSDKFDQQVFDKKWASFGSYSGTPVTGGTILRLAREAGGTDDVSSMFNAIPNMGTNMPKEGMLPHNVDGSVATSTGQPEVSTDGYTIDTKKPSSSYTGDPDHTHESTKTVHFRIIPDRPDFIDYPEPEWFIDRVLPVAELLVVYGKSMSGKSFVALDMAYAITRGTPWGAEQRRTRKGTVLYIAAEGQGGMRKRVRAFYHQFGDGEPLYFIVDSPDLLDKELTTELIQTIKDMPAVDLVIVDTFAQAMPGADENYGKDVGLALANCRTLTTVTGATVLLVHHAGKDESKGARGWSGLQAAADGEYEVKELDTQRQLKITKLKDDEAGGVFPFRLLPVEYAINEHDEPVGSAVVEWLAESEREDAQPKLKGAWQNAVYDVHSADMDGEFTTADSLIEAAIDHRGLEPNAQRRKDCRRALDQMVANGGIILVAPCTEDLY